MSLSKNPSTRLPLTFSETATKVGGGAGGGMLRSWTTTTMTVMTAARPRMATSIPPFLANSSFAFCSGRDESEPYDVSTSPVSKLFRLWYMAAAPCQKTAKQKSTMQLVFSQRSTFL